ncbi:MAG: hypothetical protein ACR2JE_09045 [Acidobacteriaceae bacterium]
MRPDRQEQNSRSLAKDNEFFSGEEDAYARAERAALALLDEGFHLGGIIRASRDVLHDR